MRSSLINEEDMKTVFKIIRDRVSIIKKNRDKREREKNERVKVEKDRIEQAHKILEEGGHYNNGTYHGLLEIQGCLATCFKFVKSKRYHVFICFSFFV